MLKTLELLSYFDSLATMVAFAIINHYEFYSLCEMLVIFNSLLDDRERERERANTTGVIYETIISPISKKVKKIASSERPDDKNIYLHPT